MSARDFALIATGAAASWLVSYVMRRSKPVWLVVELMVVDEPAFLEAWQALSEGTRSEPGNKRYVLHRPCETGGVNAPPSGRYTLIEEFKSQTALDAHNRAEHFLQHVPKLGAACGGAKIQKLTPL